MDDGRRYFAEKRLHRERLPRVEISYMNPVSTMRLRLGLWALLLVLQFLVTASPPEALAPAVAGSVYLPLMALRALGLPVISAAESGGWGGPSALGLMAVVVFWAAVWWGVVSLVGRVLTARQTRGRSTTSSTSP
ncbi:hypothetical protein HPC49_20490 [Pyxidicoccus fallax]|uniref:Uncharacterized protein n=1 Tax=Pyxidicoccus fallax TaxID=394095 RepID=A0A848LHG8_9BACT|nr:hypothetical protein [Pyxidicoccus fallax]NMO16631.1 hypothetical protein [Pyxidicoccus fallax]NPC80592.1 hypothetical protein [Pyxidicoccus fallax]